MIKTNNTTNLKNISKYLLTTTLTLGLLSATNTVIANQNSTIDNYNTRYTPQGRIKAGKRGTYKKDIHVWVYTSKFAKRFGMPQEWVDDELKGAEALAYRLDLDVYGTKCGYFSNVENCRPSTACVVDMYIDDKANLPWNTNSRFESLYGRKSNPFFVAQKKKDGPTYGKRITKRGQQYKLGLDSTGIVYGKNDKWKLGAYYILEYDRDIYKNLDYLSGSVICHSFGKERDVKIDIDNPVFRKDGSVSMKSTLAHQIKIPNSFMGRIEVYDKAQYEPNSLFKALRDRLSATTKPKSSE
ncbi:hypothetical protein [bacterium endosymbiont of Bathymodiolus sp. 5 South]|uniref:hypothetical protein n=2 Tax=bacterium endosymbiont of Bathymodiolus sp. 5 South TaxID=1181670 RepID=UPI0010B90358|nr:hypothetical protein [bacterium endosymbiont of Bathymodiolus sp. 5 South]CAC9645293.1 hypothetical protein [uncultured Gammaproteobacteria bacterium]SHN93403.1 hypothetical protein BCLUESOX_587 [bacterium endosymbiont of Bathymodiolus sp. 5 South]